MDVAGDNKRLISLGGVPLKCVLNPKLNSFVYATFIVEPLWHPME